MTTVLPKPTEGGDFAPPPAGNFPAICYRVIDLGTQTTSYLGQSKRQHKILISWEIKDEDAVTEDGQPMTIHQRYTWSMHEKAALRRDLESWRGQSFSDADFDGGEHPFDIKNILGKTCLLNIVHVTKDGKVYANIAAVSKLPKGMQVSAVTNDIAFLWLSPDDFDRAVLSTLSERLQETIKAAPEYHALMYDGHQAPPEHVSDADVGSPVHPAFDDSVPPPF